MVLLPAWLAWIVQLPAAVNVAVVPETVHTLVVCEVKLTVNPDVAVAESVSGIPTTWVPGLGKVMFCERSPVPDRLVEREEFAHGPL